MDTLTKMIEDLRKEHPYKIYGEKDTYSEYNEGWCNAIDRMEQIIAMHWCDLRYQVWLMDIPNPSTPEYRELHEKMQKIMCMMDDKIVDIKPEFDISARAQRQRDEKNEL